MAKSSLFNVFGRSPIKPLQIHMAKAYSAVAALVPFFEAVLAQNWPLAQQLRQQITELEYEADLLKRDLHLHLPKNLLLPVARSDLLAIITLQDNLANQAKDISGLIVARQILFPDVVTALFMQLLQRCRDACCQAEQAIDELDELLEAGFRGNEVQIIETMIAELIHIEHDTDEMQHQIYQALFKIEQNLLPLEAIFLYKTVEWIGNLANDAKAIGGQLQLLLAR